MRNTQWQAAVSDMEAAGLNPALAYSQGPNAAPGGAQGRVENALGEGVSSALQIKTQQEQFKLMREQRRKASAEAAKGAAEAGIARKDLDARTARWAYYFNSDGSMKKPLAQLLQQEHASKLANNARSVTDLELARLSVPERKAMARLFDQAGATGKGAQVFMPLLMQLLRGN